MRSWKRPTESLRLSKKRPGSRKGKSERQNQMLLLHIRCFFNFWVLQSVLEDLLWAFFQFFPSFLRKKCRFCGGFRPEHPFKKTSNPSFWTSGGLRALGGRAAKAAEEPPGAKRSWFWVVGLGMEMAFL